MWTQTFFDGDLLRKQHHPLWTVILSWSLLRVLDTRCAEKWLVASRHDVCVIDVPSRNDVKRR